MGKITPKVLAAIQQLDDDDDLVLDPGGEIRPEVEPTRQPTVAPTKTRPKSEPMRLSQEIYD